MGRSTASKPKPFDYSEPAIALADLLAGLGRGTTAAATGITGNLENLYRQFGKGAIANAVRQLIPTREGKATTFPTIEEMNAMMPPVVPAGAGRNTQMADVGQFFGENNPLAPTALAAVKPVAKAAARGALDLAKSEPTRKAIERVMQAAGAAPMRIVPNIALTRTFPQDEALRLAQLRAALPPEKGGLGLPANNTPEQRARAMEFDLDKNYVHSTSLPFDKVKEDGRFSGIFALPNYSANYGNVDMPLVARGKIASSSDLRGSIENPSKQKKRAIDEDIPSNITDPADIADAYVEMQRRRNELARKLGYTGVEINDEFGDTISLVSPENIRSRFAAFDPWRRDAATAAAFGVAAPDLLAQEQEKAMGGAVMMAEGGMITIEEFLRKQGY